MVDGGKYKIISTLYARDTWLDFLQITAGTITVLKQRVHFLVTSYLYV